MRGRGSSASASSSSRRAAGRKGGLGHATPYGALNSPTVQAATLRSVLSRLSDEQLARYKRAFQNADVDEDGYLNLPQAMQALHSCGVRVTSGTMLDGLDELEVAQESSERMSAWEQEQARRRRRRRRNSLEGMEMELGSYKASLHKDEDADAQLHMAEEGRAGVSGGERDGNNGNGRRHILPVRVTSSHPPPIPELDRAGSSSSLKFPTIDISTFLNLLNRGPVRAAALEAERKGGGGSWIGGQESMGVSGSSAHRQSSRAREAAAAAKHSEAWKDAGYQSQSVAASNNNNNGGGRPFAHVTTGSLSSPRLFPTMRLRDPAVSELRLTVPAAATHPTTSSIQAGGMGGVTKPQSSPVPEEDEDDEFDPELDLLAAFQTFDPHHTGYMSTHHLQSIMQHLGEKWSEEEAEEMAEEIDPRREGRFNYHQLVHHLMSRE